MGIASFLGFGREQVRIGPLSVRHWIWLMVIASAAFQYYIAQLSAVEFRQQAGDLAIFMQAFSNTGGGRLFWTTQVYLNFGTQSLLNVHFAWPIFVVYPLYAAYPSMTTLFIVQAVVLSLAAIPLSALTALLTGSQRRGLIAAGIYLVWAPMLTGMPNSFHLEAFLPVESFALVLFWWRRQFLLGLITAVLVGFTLDVGPVLTAMIGVMFLTYPLQSFFQQLLEPAAVSASTGAASPSPARPRVLTLLRSYLQTKPVQAAIALIIVSGLTFISVRYLEAHFPSWLGVGGPSLGEQRLVGFGVSNIPHDLLTKLTFWAVMFVSVGFLPFLYPRILIVLVPWIGYTFAEATSDWYELPSHYTAIAAVPLFIGVAFAFRRLSFDPRPRPSSAPAPTPRRYAGFGLRNRERFVASVAIIAVVVLVNVGLNPLNPLTAPGIARSNNPVFVGSGGPYGLTINPPPGFQEVVSLSQLVPKDGLALIDSPFSPLFAADPNAYMYNNFHNYNPFNGTNLPTYVVSDGNDFHYLNYYVNNVSAGGQVYDLTGLLWNASYYGVRAWVQDTRLGPVYLFQRNYTGPTQSFGAVSYPSINFRQNATLLFRKNTTQFAKVDFQNAFVSIGRAGIMWTAVEEFHPLPPGTYNVSVILYVTASQSCSNFPSYTTLLRLEGAPPDNPSTLFAKLSLGSYLSATPGGGGCGNWSQPIVEPLNLPSGQSSFTIYGVLPTSLPAGMRIAVSAVSLTPAM